MWNGNTHCSRDKISRNKTNDSISRQIKTLSSQNEIREYREHAICVMLMSMSVENWTRICVNYRRKALVSRSWCAAKLQQRNNFIIQSTKPKTNSFIFPSPTPHPLRSLHMRTHQNNSNSNSKWIHTYTQIYSPYNLYPLYSGHASDILSHIISHLSEV